MVRSIFTVLALQMDKLTPYRAKSLPEHSCDGFSVINKVPILIIPPIMSLLSNMTLFYLHCPSDNFTFYISLVGYYLPAKGAPVPFDLYVSPTAYTGTLQGLVDSLPTILAGFNEALAYKAGVTPSFLDDQGLELVGCYINIEFIRYIAL
jgi:hypothetical protein